MAMNMETKKSVIRTAQFESTCFRCKARIKVGQPTEPVKFAGERTSRWVHVGCRPGAGDFDEFDDVPTTSAGMARQMIEDMELDRDTEKELSSLGDGDDKVGIGAIKRVVAEAVTTATAGLDAKIGTKVVAQVKADLEKPLTDIVNKAVADGCAAAAAEFKKHMQPREIVVRRPDGTSLKLEGEILSEWFDDLRELVEYREDVFMPGPTGCGKTHMAAQVAKVLGMRFGMISCSKGMSEGMLNGRLIPRGERGQFEFMQTMLVDIYERGGLFLFDEMDAADANTLLVINSALANGVLSVPNRTALPAGVTIDQFMDELGRYDRKQGKPFKYQGFGPYAVRHPDFVAVAAANTMGTGGDRMYVGRDPLDMSTLDRFLIGTIEVGYSEKVESALCPDRELRTLLLSWRHKIDAQEGGIRRAMSTRFMMKAYEWKKRGWTHKRIAKAYFAGWSSDEIVLVYGRPKDW